MAAFYKDKLATTTTRGGPMLLYHRKPNPIATLLICYVAGLLFALFYLARTSYRDPTSYFFDSRHAYHKDHSTQLTSQAEQYVRNADAASKPAQHQGIAPKICIGIATVARRGDQYVDLTVGSLLQGLTRAERKEVFLNILVGHIDQQNHPSFANTWLDFLPDKVLAYNNDEETLEQLRAWEEGGWYRNKTIYDYTYLLRDCYETGAEYVAMIEDDTLAAAHWYRRTRNALAAIERDQVPSVSSSRWLYLRLFYSDDLHGWNSENWARYLFWSLMVWSGSCVLLLAAGGASKRASERLSLPVRGIILGLYIPTLIALYFMAGKQTVQPLRAGVHEMNQYGCCSQGLVFPRAIIPDFLDHTDLTTDWLVDMMVEKIADAEKWDRWALIPPVLQHIGLTSSKGYGFDDNAKRLWSFRFEHDVSAKDPALI